MRVVLLRSFFRRMEGIVRNHTADRPYRAAIIRLAILTVDGSDTLNEGHVALVLLGCRGQSRSRESLTGKKEARGGEKSKGRKQGY